MYNLQRFHGPRFDRLNAIIDSMGGHITSYVSLIGSGTLPLPEVLSDGGPAGAACPAEGHRDSRLFPARIRSTKPRRSSRKRSADSLSSTTPTG